MRALERERWRASVRTITQTAVRPWGAQPRQVVNQPWTGTEGNGEAVRAGGRERASAGEGDVAAVQAVVGRDQDVVVPGSASMTWTLGEVREDDGAEVASFNDEEEWAASVNWWCTSAWAVV